MILGKGSLTRRSHKRYSRAINGTAFSGGKLLFLQGRNPGADQRPGQTKVRWSPRRAALYFLIATLFVSLMPDRGTGAQLPGRSKIFRGRVGIHKPHSLKQPAKSAVVQSPQGSIPVLTYHHISEDPEQWIKDTVVKPETFDAQMRYLSENGYTTMTITEVAQAMRGTAPLPPNPAAVTFDDGYESNYTYAFPVLKKYRIKATIAVIVGFIPDEYPGRFPGRPHMTWSQMREMVQSDLVEFQSHTYDSHRLVMGDDGKKKPALIAREFLPNKRRYETDAERHRRIVNDFKRARARLRARLGVPANALFYPYGAYDDHVRQAAIEAGHDILVTIENGYNRPGDNPLEIKRFNADGTPLSEFADVVEGRWPRPGPVRYLLWQTY